MKIAIHAADLDNERIDGTRVYLLNILKKFGKINKKDDFFIYHKKSFNPKLVPPGFENYHIKSMDYPFLWTQTRFAGELLLEKPDVLWMPVQNIPFLRNSGLKTVVTIHDLAFKIFPEHFTAKDLFKLNKLANLAINRSDRIIAISNSTKNDIIRFYPSIEKEKISVVYNGFDAELFSRKSSEDDFEKLSKKYELSARSYLLYVGAIQPRKNLPVLIEAFGKVKEKNKRLKLLIAGSEAWKSESTLKKISNSRFKEDIIITGTLSFEDIAVLYKNALIFIFPSLYEGFGIPVLEAMASGIPVISADNSSLREVGGDAALYFKSEDSAELADVIESVIEDEIMRNLLVEKGIERVKNFSWEKCAKETLDKLIKW